MAFAAVAFYFIVALFLLFWLCILFPTLLVCFLLYWLLCLVSIQPKEQPKAYEQNSFILYSLLDSDSDALLSCLFALFRFVVQLISAF